ncbi:TonB-dependent receptor, partial [Pseudomonas syringae pv. tagetis]
DLMAGYQVSKNLVLQLNPNNIFDRSYYTAIGASSVLGSTDVYGNPRSYALTSKYSF